jgi:hypothetical protein
VAQEVPGPGDPDGSGEVVLMLNHRQGLICFQLTVTDMLPATGLGSTPPPDECLLVYRGQLSLPGMRAFSPYWRALDAVYATPPDLPKARARLTESARLNPVAYFVSLELGNVLARLRRPSRGASTSSSAGLPASRM